ncbi:DUF3108 domain-containing protein [Ramlibacter tataouinensis]|uniref:DUF3108 domain-containing protein n=1 Tax=Ramlibacter tataouinensis (strain ATCC BAA-407 / DSM 14655 / LMG 21543 / TTB310) TaxID=365046 RepID=F5XZI9_RAMTT|nr:DUF3108 domain-containing protein [Ramlibacter tataouinensis]AEG94546.1 conserved hypothetical protein [Ramlibacter tataouinensis TTB310]
MAVTSRLNKRRLAVPLALILALVLGGHLLLLDWLAGLEVHPAVLRPLADPMFTRLLLPQAPPPPVPQPTRSAARPAAPKTAAMESVAQPAKPAASVPSRPQAQPDPEPPPETVAQAPAPPEVVPPPEPAASAPQAAASAPAGDAATAGAGIDPAQAALGSLDSWPRDTRVNYQLSGKYRSGDLYGGARVQWQRAGPLYQARVELDITLAGSRVLTSQGEVRPEGLLPEVFEEVWRGKPRSVRMGPGTLTFNDGRTAPRPPGVQDSASQFVELSHRFATGRERLEVGRQVDIWLARPSAVDLWTYDIVDRELLRTPRLGEVEAFRLKPRPIANPRGNITAEIWFAPSLQYLPVRIRVSMGDEAHVDLMVDTIEQN